jgi:hypothetical protein
MSLDNYDKSDETSVEEIKKINDKVKEEWINRLNKDKTEAEDTLKDMTDDVLMDMKN